MFEQERLYINDTLIELSNAKTEFARTLQVNDLVSLENRQTNFTKNIRIPKTPKNIINFDFLGVAGNTSNLPYQRNKIDYFVGNESIIYNGMGMITQTSDYYDLTVYDGNIDLYKAIENRTLGELDLTEIKHTKDVDTVIDSFTGTTYKYILADYNGKALYNSTGTTVGITVNTDYLVPSVNVSWLWDKMFDNYNFTYSGDTFQTDDFKNLWLTYPKGTPSDLGTTEIFYSSGITQQTNDDFRYNVSTGKHYLEIDSFSHLEDITLSGDNITFSNTDPIKLGFNMNFNFSINAYTASQTYQFLYVNLCINYIINNYYNYIKK
jgi:hypothetical protein